MDTIVQLRIDGMSKFIRIIILIVYVFMKSLKGGSTNMQIAQHDQGYKNYLMKACNDIKVDYPNDKDVSYKRDYYLIRDADSLYFTGYFDIASKSRLQIKGRESWIVEMFANKILELRKLEDQQAIISKIKPKSHNPMVQIYMFCEQMQCWCQLNIKTFKWIYIMRAPKPVWKIFSIWNRPYKYYCKNRIEYDLIRFAKPKLLVNI